jgi:DNA-directed RNA polymerase subunit F
MTTDLSKKKIELFDHIITALDIVLKNAPLYPRGHPLVNSSLNAMKDALDGWFAAGEETFRLGVSSDNILLDGKFVRERSDIYRDVAAYLHRRGILVLSVSNKVHVDEVAEFLAVIKNDPETIARMGGVAKNTPPTPHLAVKEIDYSAILTSAKAGEVLGKDGLWAELCRIGEDALVAELPASKLEFIEKFLKDPRKAAALLNRIYKEAAAKLEKDAVIENVRNVLANINRYYRDFCPEKAKGMRGELLEIISRLDPKLVVEIFEESGGDIAALEFSNDLLNGMSNDAIAAFISALMGNEGVINPGLVGLFDRLASQNGELGSVAAIVADRLFGKELLDKDAMTTLRTSIGEIFKSYPDNDFMSHIYQLTMEAFLTSEGVEGTRDDEAGRLIKEYTAFLTKENLKKEKVRLLADIIRYEEDSLKFKQFSAELLSVLRERLENSDVESVRETFELFAERLRPEQLAKEGIANEVKEALEVMRAPDVIEHLVSSVPKVDMSLLGDIAYVLAKIPAAAESLLEAFAREANPLSRGRFAYLLSNMGKAAARDVSERLGSIADGEGTPQLLKELLKVLKNLDPEEAWSAARRLLKHRDGRVRISVLEFFTPRTKEDARMIFDIFETERDPEALTKIIAALVRTSDDDTIARLFERFGKGFFNQSRLLEVIRLCGDFKVRGAVSYLGRILGRRPFFSTKAADDLRLASAISLGRIGTTDALEFLRSSINDGSEPVRRMCGYILKKAEEK